MCFWYFLNEKDFWVFQDETEEISSVLINACDADKNDELDLPEVTGRDPEYIGISGISKSRSRFSGIEWRPLIVGNINKFIEQQEWSNLWKFAENSQSGIW